MSASRLQKLAEVLRVPISYFFDGLDGQGGGESKERHEEEFAHLIRTPQAVQLNQAFHRIQSSDVRRKILALLKELANVREYDDRQLH